MVGFMKGTESTELAHAQVVRATVFALRVLYITVFTVGLLGFECLHRGQGIEFT